MIVKNFIYNDYNIEIHEHPIYHDFEFVVKTLDNLKVIGTSNRTFEYLVDAEHSAMLLINLI